MRFARGDQRDHIVSDKTDLRILQSLAAVETSENRLSRDYHSRSIFDFCNSIGTCRTWRDVQLESVIRTKAGVRQRLWFYGFTPYG
jgi:hypothetical protein